jgi:hypothetical protein
MTGWIARFVLLAAGLAGTATSATAGIEIVEVAKIQVVRAVSGFVRDPNGSPVGGATVAEVSADHKTILRSVTTDKNGGFALPREPRKKIYHLMVSAYGFNPLLVHVKTSWWRKRLLDLRLELTT